MSQVLSDHVNIHSVEAPPTTRKQAKAAQSRVKIALKGLEDCFFKKKFIAVHCWIAEVKLADVNERKGKFAQFLTVLTRRHEHWKCGLRTQLSYTHMITDMEHSEMGNTPWFHSLLLVFYLGGLKKQNKKENKTSRCIM